MEERCMRFWKFLKLSIAGHSREVQAGWWAERSRGTRRHQRGASLQEPHKVSSHCKWHSVPGDLSALMAPGPSTARRTACARCGAPLGMTCNRKRVTLANECASACENHSPFADHPSQPQRHEQRTA